jgi:nicotinamidase-related amidase
MRKVFIIISTVLVIVGALQAQGKDEASSKRMRPALIVIDIQNQFLPMVPEREKEVSLYMINEFIDLFRKNGFPIIQVHHTDPQSGPKPGTEAFEFPATVRIKTEDPLVVKNYGNSFKKTDLQKILQEKKCNTVFLCGLSSVACVMATYFGARDLDYNAFMLKDAIMSHNSNYTDDIEEIYGALNYEAVEIMLANSEK